MKRILLLFALIIALSASGCGPASEVQGGLTPQTHTVKPEPTPTPTPTPLPAPTQTPDPTQEPTPELGSRLNPMPIGEAFLGTYTSGGYDYAIGITLQEVVRGEEAWNMLYEANRFNDKPPEGKEYILARFTVGYISDLGGEDRALEISDWDFKFSTGTYRVEDLPSVVVPEPEFDLTLYELAYGDGWVAFLADVDDNSPKAVFLDSLWFNLGSDSK